MTSLGQLGEQLVEKKYLERGFKLLERNYVFPRGIQTCELDLIFSKADEIVFVEVKARRNEKFGSPFDAVDTNKQRKLVKTAKLYLHLHPKYQKFNYRIDVAAVEVDNPADPVIILENAIEDLD